MKVIKPDSKINKNMNANEIIICKGGSGEKVVKIESIQIPDLWHAAQGSPFEAEILQCWHLAHDMKRELLERCGRGAMTKAIACDLLAIVRAELGRGYKAAIRDAWIDGNYSDRGLGEWASQLQQARNSFGPSWLVSAKPLAIKIC